VDEFAPNEVLGHEVSKSQFEVTGAQLNARAASAKRAVASIQGVSKGGRARSSFYSAVKIHLTKVLRRSRH
jgi:hypothetical protein